MSSTCRRTAANIRRHIYQKRLLTSPGSQTEGWSLMCTYWPDGRESAGARKEHHNMSIERISHSSVVLGAVVTTLCVTALGIGLAGRAAADERDKKTVVTFSAPVELPGKALPAGTYVFKLL